MSYCINPNCPHRYNPDDLEICTTCGTKLLINERYQIANPLRIGQGYNSEVFEVRDLNEGRTLKILKSLVTKYNNSKLIELFEREAQVLIWLSTDWQSHPGIPKVKPDGYFYLALGNSPKKLPCLVMEKIEGQNLEEWVEQNQPISQAQALNWLQQLVEILDKVHRQGLWHRDIKPSNIMLKPDGQLVLIDFGSVGIGETRIVSVDYTPPEQIEGKTVLQSDFFALGRTFVYLLTGKDPNEFTKNLTAKHLNWRNSASGISSNLAQLIDDLMAAAPANRPRNAQEILQRLQSIRSPRRRWKRQALLMSAIFLFLGLAGSIYYHSIPCQSLGGFKPCPVVSIAPLSQISLGDRLSFGEEVLIPGSALSEKQQGVDAFREGQYDRAINWLEKAREQQRSDPETLIYLNNAKVLAKDVKTDTIAVAVPLDTSSEGLNSGLEILRGVAQAQDELNQGHKRVGIKVLIADDANKSVQAEQVAQSLVNQKDVLAVVGHYTSDLTLAAAEVYQQNQLVFISPTSTSEDLTVQDISYGRNFFFRTVPSDRITAETLADYLSQSVNQQTAAIFYNSRSRYSDSLQKQFRDTFSKNGGRVVDEVDLSNTIINIENAIAKASNRGAKVFALFPNSQSLILNKAIKLIDMNQCRYFMVGGDAVYAPDILNLVGKEAVNCLVIAVPWHRTASPDKQFPKTAEQLWAGSVSWRTALAYDATRVLLAALEKERIPTRSRLQQALANPNFQVMGATGRIHFQRNGDRADPQIQLVQIQLNKQGRPEFSVPEN